MNKVFNRIYLYFNEILFKNNFSLKIVNYHDFEKNNQII
jgi:hypothetical protein